MSTHNRGDLEDFNTLIGFGQINADYRINSWLKLAGQFNGVFVPNSSGLERRDAITGKGPIYEANLFNLRTMSGQSEFALPVLNAQINLKGQTITVGRFTKNEQALHSEQWPFPNALEGIWYENHWLKNTKWQVAVIHKAMPRFSGNFETIGQSIGVAGVGVNPDGSPSGYRGNINSRALIVGNYTRSINKEVSIDIWDYFVEEVMNTLIVEPKISLQDSQWNVSLKAMVQTKVGEGGNLEEQLSYKTDQMAIQIGFRTEKKLSESSSLQLNFTRITNDGRFLLPREWGFEPFYTFQKRNRIEGTQNATSLMMSWKKQVSTEKWNYQFTSSLGRSFLPDVMDYQKNKYQVPSNFNLDAELKIQPVKFMTGLSLDLLMAYRFLADDSEIAPQYLINQANFFHTDLRISWSF